MRVEVLPKGEARLIWNLQGYSWLHDFEISAAGGAAVLELTGNSGVAASTMEGDLYLLWENWKAGFNGGRQLTAEQKAQWEELWLMAQKDWAKTLVRQRKELRAVWSAVEAVAEALLDKGRLSYRQVNTICRRTEVDRVSAVDWLNARLPNALANVSNLVAAKTVGEARGKKRD